MVYRYYRLPSLTSLAAFEASARHRSMQRAGAELNVTTGAVSRQIKALEEELGVALFVRSPSGLILTADAEALYAVLSQAFSRTAEAVSVIRSGNRARRATLACTHAFAAQWLMPRMGAFWRRLRAILLSANPDLRGSSRLLRMSPPFSMACARLRFPLGLAGLRARRSSGSDRFVRFPLS